MGKRTGVHLLRDETVAEATPLARIASRCITVSIVHLFYQMCPKLSGRNVKPMSLSGNMIKMRVIARNGGDNLTKTQLFGKFSVYRLIETNEREKNNFLFADLRDDEK